MRKAVVRDTDGLVLNVIEIEEGANWQLPEDCYLIDAGDGSPGDTWDGVDFIKPALPEPDIEQATCEEYLSHSPDVITQPEIWYLLRAFGKKLGYEVD